MKAKPDLSFWKLWNLSFGFFGVQIAYALQSSQVSRIFSTIGADPHDLSYFWILPPLMGLFVQPIVGSASDRTWTRFGRRLPYLIVGALVAIIVMCFLPNSGSLGLEVLSAIIFGLIMLMFLDTSINMAMQPFKMLVGDFVNEKQKGLAYSIQSFLCNAGSVVGYVTPFLLAMFLSNTAPEGEVPQTVTWAFYIGAAILLLCVIYTFAKVKEMPPHEYAEYHGIKEPAKSDKKNKPGMLKLLVSAPKVFWTVGLVQFFCWAAFLYMWTYSTDAVAIQAFNAPVTNQSGISIKGEKFDEKNIFNGENPVILNGRISLAGINVDGNLIRPQLVAVKGSNGNDTIVKDGNIVTCDGIEKIAANGHLIAKAGAILNIDGKDVTVADQAVSVSEMSLLKPGTILTMAHIAKKVDGRYVLEQTAQLPTWKKESDLKINNKVVLNSSSKAYQDAGDWNGNLLAVQGIAAVLWAIVLAWFRNRRIGYSLSLLIGAAGFISVFFIHNQFLLCVSYALMGCAWAAMLAMPFTILTNALSGGNIGTYLGLFNCTICLPQIIAAICGGFILGLFPDGANGAPQTVLMLTVSGILLLCGAASVWIIKETYGSQSQQTESK